MNQTYLRIPVLFASLAIALTLTLAVPAHAQSSEQIQHLLARADANGDGAITRAEFDRVRSDMFARMDRNGDDFVDGKDRPPMLGERFDQAFSTLASLDSNGDRRISRSELAEGEAPAFEAGDTNRDAVLSRTEMAALNPPR